MTAIVSVLRCDGYEPDAVKESVRQSCKNLGGLDKYIKKGDRVLLKANLLISKKPEEAATTHPAFIRALVEVLLEHGAKAVIIGDSPGGPFNELMLKGLYKKTGMEQAVSGTVATLNSNFKSCEKENPDGILLKRITLTDMINDVDKVISVSKLKTHGMMTFTGAVKNMFGCVPGVIKAEYHLNLPDYMKFADALIDICLCVKPVLSFMDGIVGMEGHGPSGGNPVKLNAVLASDSPYHLDKVACSIIKLGFSDVPTITRAYERGITSNDLSDITFRGEPYTAFIPKSFEIPQTKYPSKDKLPGFMKRFVEKHLQPRPVFNLESCTGCGTCAESCPAKIIKMKGRTPLPDLDGCIRCFCCQELCPRKAVEIYRPRLLKLMKL